MTADSIQITKAKLSLRLSNGTDLVFELSPAQLELFVRGSGIVIHDIDESHFGYYCFDDKTIKNNILPLLPELK
jgi:hypothetical protein